MITPIPIPMSTDAYLFSISRMTCARELHGMAAEIAADDALHTEEKEELLAAIDRRFGQLNLQAAGTMKPRWD